MEMWKIFVCISFFCVVKNMKIMQVSWTHYDSNLKNFQADGSVIIVLLPTNIHGICFDLQGELACVVMLILCDLFYPKTISSSREVSVAKCKN